jgi:hypothetical protein
MYSEPLSPVLALPVLRTRRPLTPAAPAFAVVRKRDPLDVTEL